VACKEDFFMVFHFGSFTLGFVSGFATAKLLPRLRGVGVQLATAAVKVSDLVSVRLARGREDIEDIWAEARARARGATVPPERRS
jgi:hypothetical protein